MKRKGSTVVVAFILGFVFFAVVTALLKHSSGELKHVKSISAVKKAELLSMSGIDWAESELRKGRWYGTDFVPYEKNAGKHASYGIKDLAPFGKDEGTVTVVCEDVANKTPGTNAHGMQQLWYLHHINVYALGLYENQSCLVYGRYIISPEPILNSKSTEGADFDSPENGIIGGVGVFVPTSKVNGETVSDFVVKEVKKELYDSVDINTVVAILNPVDNPEVDVPVKPTTFGTIADIRIDKGQTCSSGDNIMVLSKTIEAGEHTVTPRTLKKMVRITKIPLEIYKNLDIEDRNDRYALSQYINGLSDAYLQNFVAHASLDQAIKENGDQKYAEKLTSAEVLKLFPAHITATTKNRAENTFLAYMIKNFTAPGGTWEQKEKALNSTFLKLDHPKTTQPPAELVEKLNKYNLTSLLNTKPRMNSRYFEPHMKNDEFMELLEPHLNEPSEQFIKTLSELPDSSRSIVVDEYGDYGTEYVNREDANSIQIIDPSKEYRVTVEKITKPYTFVDPESGFGIEMNDLMAFIKKYYDDSDSMAPREDIRTNENIDWPLPAPAPAPPAEVPGGTWVWIPGTPGTPPGEPTYTHSGGSEKKVDPPTAGSGAYEPTSIGDPDGGSKEWKIEGEPGTDGGDQGGDKDPKESENPGSVNVCNCCGGSCSKCNGTEPEKIKMNVGTEWKVKPGTAGKDPTQGKYVWQENQQADDDGSGGDDDSDGSGHGGGNGSDSGSGGGGGFGGSGGSGSYGGGGGGGGGSSGGSPSRATSTSGCC